MTSCWLNSSAVVILLPISPDLHFLKCLLTLLLMKPLIIILIYLWASWHFTELGSDDVLNGVLAPLGVVVFLIALAIWLVLNAGFGARNIRHKVNYGQTASC